MHVYKMHQSAVYYNTSLKILSCNVMLNLELTHTVEEPQIIHN